MGDQALPDPQQITDLAGLSRALTLLRRRGAQSGQMQLSVRDLATRTGRAPSSLHPYLRGQRLPPANVYSELLAALEIPDNQMRHWLDAWDRLADTAAGHRSAPPGPHTPAQRPGLANILRTETIRYRLHAPDRQTPAWINIITGDVRRVRDIDVWVNSENTAMQMSRPEEYSISASIRYEGAVIDDAGRVIDDRVGAELAAAVAGRVPLAPAAAITTGPGELHRYGVRHIIHVASVQGEPGAGYRQVLDVGRCLTNALTAAENLHTPDSPVRSILVPLLGAGTGGADPHPTVTLLLEAAVDHLTTLPEGHIRAVFFLASTQPELDTCLDALNNHPRLHPHDEHSIGVTASVGKGSMRRETMPEQR